MSLLRVPPCTPCLPRYVNGARVGFCKDSRAPAEFNITAALRRGPEQLLCVRVYRYSDGSMLEDQDHWRLSGIHRDVRLLCLPTPAAIRQQPGACEPQVGVGSLSCA